MISEEKREYNRLYYLAHREEMIASQKRRDAQRPDEVRAYKQRHHAENRERENARSRRNWKLYYPANRSKVRDYHRDHYLKNRDRIVARHALNYEVSKTATRARHKAWQAANRERWNCLLGRHRARKLSAEGSHTPREWLAKLRQFGFACAYCGATNIVLTEDHVVALSKGGSDYISNIVPACRRCNSKKRDKPAESMRMKGGDSDVIEVC